MRGIGLKQVRNRTACVVIRIPEADLPNMTAADVISLYSELEKLKIKIWVDGGWGVDALLGEQTRPHQDFDIAIQQKDVPRLRQLLQERGYKDTKLEEA